MKGKYITTQVLLACLSKPVLKPVVKVSYPTTRIIERKKTTAPVESSMLVEA